MPGSKLSEEARLQGLRVRGEAIGMPPRDEQAFTRAVEAFLEQKAEAFEGESGRPGLHLATHRDAWYDPTNQYQLKEDLWR